MGKSKYNSVDELPDLSKEPVYQVDTETKKVTRYNNVDELPDLKKKVGSLDFGKSSLSASVPPYTEENNEIPTFTDVEVGEDPISLAIKAGELKNKKSKEVVPIGSSFGMGSDAMQQVPDDNALLEAKQIKERLKKDGFDADELSQEFRDFPKEAFNAQNTSKEALLKLRTDNPIQYHERLNNTKTTYQIAKSAGVHLANQFNDLNSDDYNSLATFISAKQQQQKIINETLTGEERTIANKRLQENAEKFINPTQPELIQEYESSPLKSQVDATQYAALKTEELFEPERYKRDIAILSAPQTNQYVVTRGGDMSFKTTDKNVSDKMGGELTQVSIDKQIGREKVLRELNERGKYNTLMYLRKQQYELDNAFANAGTEEEKDVIREQYVNTQSEINKIQESEKTEAQRFPLTEKLKLDNLFKEKNQTTDQNLLSYAGNSALKGFNNTQDTWEDLITNFTGSNEDKALLQQKRLGEEERWRNKMFLPSSLTKSNNLFSKANAYKIAGFTGDIASFMAQTSLGGGGKAAEIATLFNTTYAGAYNQATEEGMSSSMAHEYGIVHGGVMMLAGLFGSKYDQVKKILSTSKSPLSKEIAGIGEAAWDNIVNNNKGVISKIASSAKDVAKEQAKMIGTFGVGATIASDLANKGFFNKEVSAEEMIDHAVNAAKDMAIGGVALAGAGFMNKVRKSPATMLDKMNIWEIGDNPEIGKVKIDEAMQRGDITPQDAELRKKAIDNVSSLIQKVPEVNDKGKPLTEKQKVDFLYNSVVKTKSSEAKKDLPEKQSEDAEHDGSVAEFKNQIILSSPTEKQLEARKVSLQKSLEPKKDAEGKAIELPEQERKQAEAEVQAIKEIQEESLTQKTKEDAIQEQSANEMDVLAEAENGEGVGERNIQPEVVTGEKISEVKSEETPKWEEVKQKSTTEFREPEKVKEILEVELPDKNVEAEYTDVIEGKTKLDKVKYIQRDAKRNHKLLELLINCLTK